MPLRCSAILYPPPNSNVLLNSFILRSALHWAAMNGHAAVCAMLVKAGADFNTKNSFGMSAFGEAEAAGHMEVSRCVKEG